MARTKTPPDDVSTIGMLLGEVEEAFSDYQRALQKLRRAKPGGEAYLDQLAYVDTELFVLKVKVDEAFKTVEKFEDSLPEDGV